MTNALEIDLQIYEERLVEIQWLAVSDPSQLSYLLIRPGRKS